MFTATGFRDYFILACWIVALILFTIVTFDLWPKFEQKIELLPAALGLWVLGVAIDRFVKP